MQTQYQLLYRYINETTNTAITNEFDYEETKEFYNDDHKLYYSQAKLLKYVKGGKDNISDSKVLTQFQYDNRQNDNINDDSFYDDTSEDNDALAAQYVEGLVASAEAAREQIILDEMANANKSNNFYIYTGTTKEYHQKYVPATLGYKVANLKAVPESQIPSGPNDFSKSFVMLGGKKLGVDGAFLVCKSDAADAYSTSYVKDFSDKDSKEDQPDPEQIIINKDELASTMIFDYYDPTNKAYKPEYGEKKASIVDIDIAQSVNDNFGNGRIITLSGVDYLITSAVQYKVSGSASVSYKNNLNDDPKPSASEKRYWWVVSYTISGPNEEKGTGKAKQEWGTIFYGVEGDVNLPKQIYFATEDKSTLATGALYGKSSSITDGQEVFAAFSDYVKSKDVPSVEGTKQTSESKTKNDDAVKEQNTHKTDNAIDKAISEALNKHTNLIVYKGWKVSSLEAKGLTKYAAKFSITEDNLIKYPIPEHYESGGTAPYLIKDNYKKIPLSPWILHSVHNSLESGLNKAKQLVSMIGLNNVKLIKTVPFDQFIKLK